MNNLDLKNIIIITLFGVISTQDISFVTAYFVWY